MPERVQDDLNHTELAHVRAKLVQSCANKVYMCVCVCAPDVGPRDQAFYTLYALALRLAVVIVLILFQPSFLLE